MDLVAIVLKNALPARMLNSVPLAWTTFTSLTITSMWHAKAAHRYSLDAKHAFPMLHAPTAKMDFSLETEYAFPAHPRIYFAQNAAVMETPAHYVHFLSSLATTFALVLQSHQSLMFPQQQPQPHLLIPHQTQPLKHWLPFKMELKFQLFLILMDVIKSKSFIIKDVSRELIIATFIKEMDVANIVIPTSSSLSMVIVLLRIDSFVVNLDSGWTKLLTLAKR